MEELPRDNGAAIGTVWRDFQRGVHRKTALTVTIIDRVLDDLAAARAPIGYSSAVIFNHACPTQNPERIGRFPAASHPGGGAIP